MCVAGDGSLCGREQSSQSKLNVYAVKGSPSMGAFSRSYLQDRTSEPIPN